MTRSNRRIALACAGVLFIAGVAFADTATPTIGKVFFAQQHVLAPDDPLFKLVGDLPALLKVQVTAAEPVASPAVVAVLEQGGRKLELPLKGPAKLPPPYKGVPELMPQRFRDSFTAMIPKEWVRTGLKVTVEMREPGADGTARVIGEPLVLGTINVGAPTKLVLNMFDVHYFGGAKDKDYPEGWEQEFAAKLPIAGLDVRRVRDIDFDTLVMPPMRGKPAIRCTSTEDYERQAGFSYDGEQGIALKWVAALKKAAGGPRLYRLYYVTICGVPSGGQAWGFQGCGNVGRAGIMLHELGHAFGLPHWDARHDYPYRGTLYGIPSKSESFAHVGPAWGFDVVKGEFIPPTIQTNAVGGTPGQWKQDPMMGGGSGDQEPGYIYRCFSDYSDRRMQDYFENRAYYRDEKTGKLMKWDPERGAYADVDPPEGTRMPVEEEIDVISVLVSASGPTPEANIVYPPIGPYKTGRIALYDAASAEDRRKAKDSGFAAAGGEVCLRVTQGGKTRTYLLPVGISPDDNPLDGRSFHVAALNLPAREGAVTRAELLYTPDVMTQGVGGAPKVLSTWSAPPAITAKR